MHYYCMQFQEQQDQFLLPHWTINHPLHVILGLIPPTAPGVLQDIIVMD